MPEETIQGIYVSPGAPARELEVKNALLPLQRLVQGNLEVIYPFGDDIALVCNEEGKLRGLRPSRALLSPRGEVLDVIFGSFFLCGTSEDAFRSLRSEEKQQMMEKFREPELFRYQDGKIKVTKIDLQKRKERIRESTTHPLK